MLGMKEVGHFEQCGRIFGNVYLDHFTQKEHGEDREKKIVRKGRTKVT